MLAKMASTLQWLPTYFAREIARSLRGERVPPKHIYFCICDHFEPYWNKVDRTTARKRIQQWLDHYPKIADEHRDSEGNLLKYSFFYPEEEYREEDLSALAKLCHAGYGEVEIHLHHDYDTSENLRKTLFDYKKRLHEKHGLLSIDKKTGEIVYGFIHGNWALDNSRPDGRWCGVNDEITILKETGCYADFTMPSAPSPTQTRKVNSVYYAIDDPARPKSHNWGKDVVAGQPGKGLLMVQGPLGLTWSRPKWGFLPRIENGGLLSNIPISLSRVAFWISMGIHVHGATEHVFVKIYTHGTQEKNMRHLFEDSGLSAIFKALQKIAQQLSAQLHFISARELANIIHHLEENGRKISPDLKNSRYVLAKEPYNSRHSA